MAINSEPLSYGIELPIATADELRELIQLFPRDLALHRGFLLRVADELDMLHSDMWSAGVRIDQQADLLSRQRNAAQRCLAIAQEEAEVYNRQLFGLNISADDFRTFSGATMACRRIADRIEGEVLT